MPDGPRVGGITPFLKIAQLAEHAGVMLAPHFAMELHIHLAAAYKTEPWVEHFEWLEPLFNERIRSKTAACWCRPCQVWVCRSVSRRVAGHKAVSIFRDDGGFLMSRREG